MSQPRSVSLPPAMLSSSISANPRMAASGVELVRDVGEELVPVLSRVFDRDALQKLALARNLTGPVTRDGDEAGRAEKEEVRRERGTVEDAAPGAACGDIAADQQHDEGRGEDDPPRQEDGRTEHDEIDACVVRARSPAIEGTRG